MGSRRKSIRTQANIKIGSKRGDRGSDSVGADHPLDARHSWFQRRRLAENDATEG
jgi:hypothetical protein